MLKLSVPVTAVLLLLLVSPSNGFLQVKDSSVKSKPLFALPTPEESAKALSDYMAKSHENKLNAIKEVEDKKNAEIQELKKEIELLKSQSASSSSSSIVPAVEGSTEDLVSKLNAYQKFMSDYIVRAQEDKYKAVKEAEASVAQKYEAKMSLLLGATTPATTPATTTGNNIFDARNEKITAAGKAGKSRWGNMEVQKVSTGGVSSSTPPTSIVAPTSSTTTTSTAEPSFDSNNPPPEVIAADHGLRADGGIGGLTLAERVALGASAASTSTTTTAPSVNPIFEKRNALVSAAGKAGKSRWGVMEIEKATNFAKTLPSSSSSSSNNNVVVDKPEVVAADHGLRADGGIGGPTLSERVNLGAMLLSA